MVRITYKALTELEISCGKLVRAAGVLCDSQLLLQSLDAPRLLLGRRIVLCAQSAWPDRNQCEGRREVLC